MIIGIIVAVIIYLLIGMYITVSFIKEKGEGPSVGYMAVTLFWPIFIFISLIVEPDIIDQVTPTKYIKKFYEYLVDKI